MDALASLLASASPPPPSLPEEEEGDGEERLLFFISFFSFFLLSFFEEEPSRPMVKHEEEKKSGKKKKQMPSVKSKSKNPFFPLSAHIPRLLFAKLESFRAAIFPWEARPSTRSRRLEARQKEQRRASRLGAKRETSIERQCLWRPSTTPPRRSTLHHPETRIPLLLLPDST